MAKSKRDYQTVIFMEFESVFVVYKPADGASPELKAKITWGKGNIATDDPLVTGLPGGGAVFPGLDWDSKKFAGVGYKFAEFDTGHDPGDNSLPTQIDNIIHSGLFNRFMHKEHKTYGVNGSKFFGFGHSFGAISMWALNIVIDQLLTNTLFASPLNDLYPNAKMSLRGSASMSGGVNDEIYKLIGAGNKNHLDSHGDKDTILPIKKSIDAIARMNSFVPGSRLDTYVGVGHGLEGHQDEALQKILVFFAGLMKIAPVVNPIV